MRKLLFCFLVILIFGGMADAQEAKIVIENYDSLHLKEIRTMMLNADSQYVDRGVFVRWYESGTRWMDGRYDGDQPEGTVTEYREDLTRNSESVYEQGEKVEEIFYNKRGLEELSKSKQPSNQVFTRVDEITTPAGEYVQREGYDQPKGIFINHGKAQVWSEKDGPLYEEGIFRRGKLHGLVVRYYPDGKKEFEGTYKDGKQDGIWIYWDSTGAVERLVIYKDNEIKSELTP